MSLPKSKTTNRRGAMRKVPRGTVKVECRRGSVGLGKNLLVRFVEFSEGGMRLVVSASLLAREEVEILIFGANQTKPIKRLANVCWSVPEENAGNYLIGVEFQKKLLFIEVAQNARPQ